MGKWLYTWRVQYYSGGFIYTKLIEAKTKADALKRLHENVKRVTEVICCVRTDRW